MVEVESRSGAGGEPQLADFDGLRPGIDREAGTRLVDQVMYYVAAHIRDRGFVPGAILPSESAFAVELGVSRAVVREAFRSLSALKLIDVGAGRRARVSAIDSSVLGMVVEHAVRSDQVSIQQIYDVRRTVEIRTAALAAMRRDEAGSRKISELAAAMRSDFPAPERVMEHDIAFHEAIGGACRNPMFSLIVASFSAVTRQTWRFAWRARPDDDARMESVACHGEIAAAIAAQDPRRAERAMAEHFDLSVKALLAAGVN